MKTLVFDTCFNKTYIVLNVDGKVLSKEAIESNDKNYHSAYLIPKIRDILKQNKILIKDLDALGVNIGPGSFTGIRAGITIARVLAQQTNIKLVGVTSLEILSKLNKNDKKTIVVSDARKNKVYYAEYKNGEVLTNPFLLEKDELISKITEQDVVIADSSISNYLAKNSISSINFDISDENFGMFLSEIVNSKLSNNEQDYNWAKVKPLYIQKPSITKPKELRNE